MKRPMRWIVGSLGGLSALLLLSLMLLIFASNTLYGRTAIERAAFIFSGGHVQISELGGDFLGQASIGRIVLQDAAGAWLTVDELQLDWRPGKLLSGKLALDRLQARNIQLERMPAAKKASNTSAKPSLPLAIDLRSLAIDRLELAPALAGEAAVFSINGRLELSAINRGQIELQINRLGKQGAYRLQTMLTDDAVEAHLSLQEAASGPLAMLAGLSNQEALNLTASLSGPWEAVHSHLELKLDDLHALLDGDIDWVQTSVDLTLTAKSAVMTLRPEWAWRTLALDMQLRGPLTALHVNNGLQLDKLKVGSTSLDQLAINMHGQLNLGESDNLWANVVGEAAKFDLGMTLQGHDLTVSGQHLHDQALSLTAVGSLIAGHADFNWQAQLDKLSATIPGDEGRLTAQGRLYGQLDDFALNGELASQGDPNGNIAANLQLQHLPHRADGWLKLGGVLLHAPLDLQLTLNSPDPDSLRIAINQANWKSAQAMGDLLLTRGSPVPAGKIDLKIERLADLQALIKQPISGSIKASLETVMQNNRPLARLMLTADNTGLEGSVAIKHSRLELSIIDPASRPMLNGSLDLNGVNAGKLDATAKIKLNGALDALSLGISIGAPNLSGSDAQISATALLNTSNRSILLNALQANWRQQTLRLLGPAKFAYRNGLSVDRLRLGLQQAELEVAGRITPDLALTAELHQTSAELLSLFAPLPPISGTLHANANLHGSLLQPTGLLRVDADQLQFKPSRGLPPARLTASAVLHGESVDLDATLKAGGNIDLRIAGQAPINRSGLFAMHSEAALDFKLLDPLLNAAGRRLRGQLAANAQLSGKWSSPLLSGTAQINHGEWQDFTSGVGISDISAALAVEQGRLRIVKMAARAGPGTLSVTGGISLLTAGMPVDLTITARNARPLASDQLTVNLDADVVLGGLALERMTASGRIHINRADMQIPERLPVGIAVLKLSGGTPALAAATPEESSNISLNLTIDAPREIFIRGRGMDAELGGTVQVSGDLNHLHPNGDFKLRNGQYSLAGQVLVFNQGSVGFDNNSLTNPSLNFVAVSTRNNITATVTVSGSARKLKIALSSTPILPQDEVLANLLFGKGATSLSALEMVQIGAALASLTGVTAGIGDPLESARKLLGLDRLSAGGVNPSLDAGRYIAPGVYLGAKQGIAGGAPQPVIQIDITKHLKLEGGVGSGAAASSTAGSTSTNSVGVIYQIEY